MWKQLRINTKQLWYLICISCGFSDTVITAANEVLRRLCFYRCLSVHRVGVCVAGGRAWQGVCALSGHRHATISLICMSTHKVMAARCLSYHQAAYRQPAIQALATARPKRALHYRD